MSEFLEQALKLAEHGIPVFPCHPNEKKPATANGFKDATTDPEQIRAWWEAEPDCNIAIVPANSGWAVVDLDPGGEVEWINLLKQHGDCGQTYTVRTPRGGRHYYFKGELATTASKLAPHIDTRGVGGYVLVPPSVVEGRPYEVEFDNDIIPAPTWLAGSLGVGAERSQVALEPQSRDASDVSKHRATARLRALVESGDVAIEGRGGNQRTYQLAAEIIGLTGSDGATAELLKEHWNPHCQPPWSDEELETIVTNAWKYKQNGEGNEIVAPATETFGEKAAAFVEVMRETQPRKSRYVIRHEVDMDKVEDVKWIVKDLIPEDSTILWVGASQTFKSFLLLDVLLSVASGGNVSWPHTAEGVVLYGALEDIRAIEGNRRKAWKDARGVKDLENFRTSIVPFIEMDEDVKDWIKQIELDLKCQKLKLIAIDTAGKAMGGKDENSSTDVRLFWRVCDLLRETFGCSVVAIHHSGKDSSRGARGSSSWTADFDTVIETSRPSRDHLNVEIQVRKHKNAGDGQRWHFKGRQHLGSLVFDPVEAKEHAEVIEETSDIITPAKVGKALAARMAHSHETALSTAELYFALGRPRDTIEKGTREIEKLAKTELRAYCDATANGLQWFYNRRET